MQAQIAAAPRATSPRRSALRKVSPRGPQRFGTPERRASFRDQSPSVARESSVADVHTFALSAEEKQEKAAAAAPSLAKAAEAYAEQASGSSASGLPAAVLPPGWDAVVSQSSGDTYYRNVVTEATQWEIPQYPVLPPGWTHGTSTSTGNVYYVAPNGESTYIPPNKAGKPFKPKTKGVPLACCAKPSNKAAPPSMFPPPSPPPQQPEYGDITPKGETGALELAETLLRELASDSDAHPAPSYVAASPPPQPQQRQPQQMQQPQGQQEQQEQSQEQQPQQQPSLLPSERATQLEPQLRLEPASPPPPAHLKQPGHAVPESEPTARLHAELGREKQREEELEMKQAAVEIASLRSIQSELRRISVGPSPPAMPAASPPANEPVSPVGASSAQVDSSVMVDEIWGRCDGNGTGFLTKQECLLRAIFIP